VISLISKASQGYGNVASGTVTLASVPPRAFVAVGVSGYYQSVSYVRDTTNGRAIDFTRAHQLQSGGGWAELWYLPNAPGGTLTLTVAAPSSTTAYLTLLAAAFTGVQPFSQPRATAGQGGSASSITTLQTGSLVAASGDLIISVIGWTGAPGTITWNSGEADAGTASGAAEPGAMGWAIADGSNAIRKVTWTAASAYDALISASFRAAPDFAGRRPSRPGRFRRPAY